MIGVVLGRYLSYAVRSISSKLDCDGDSRKFYVGIYFGITVTGSFDSKPSATAIGDKLPATAIGDSYCSRVCLFGE